MILGGSEDDADGSPPRTGPGLGLPEVIVDMHFAERQRLPRLLAAAREQPSHLGVGIDEDTAILVRQGGFEVLGRGTVTIVDARGDVRLHRQSAGDSFRLRQRKPDRANH
jgi:cyanophycinase